MKILVTGATGFLGSHLVQALVRRQHQVIVLKRSSSDTRRIAGLLPALAAYDLDRCELSQPFRDHDGIDAVLHAATCYGRGGEGFGEVFAANLAFPLSLLETARRFGVASFINTDTCLEPGVNAYALSKKQFAQWGKLLAQAGGTRFVNLVLEHFYGPGDLESKFVTHVIKSCLAGVPELKLTLGEQTRDFIYIDDVVEAYLCVLDKALGEGPAYSEYPLGSGREVAIRELVETIHRLTGSGTRLAFGALPYRTNEQMSSRADTGRLQALGWRATTELAQGLQQTIRWEQLNRGASA